MIGAEWVAGAVRARALARRRIGPASARQLAASPSLDEAVRALADTPYGHDVRPGQTLAEAEHAIGGALLWHLRVLAGWLPRQGVEPLRVLAGWFELANVDEHTQRIAGGGPGQAPYRLGALASAWPRLAATSSLEGLRAALATSPWGDPGAATPHAIAGEMRLAYAQRVIAAFPMAEPLATGAVALLVARELFDARRPLDAALGHRAAILLGEEAMAAGSLPQMAARVHAPARWALADLDDPSQLWRAESGWWRRLEHDGFTLLGSARYDLRAVIGATAVLAVDAWRARAALACAARAGSVEVFDAVV